eukprot:15358885-Ditylum_brightwellii.AAC.1
MFRTTTTTTVRNLATTTTKPSKEARDAALRHANEQMKSYYVNRPPIEKLIKKRKAFGDNPGDSQHFMQGVLEWQHTHTHDKIMEFTL